MLLFLFSLLFPFFQPEKKLLVQKIVIEGNVRTREYIIRRELALHEGDTVLKEKLPDLLEKEHQKLQNTALFNKIALDFEEIEPNGVIIHIRLQERWYLAASPVIALTDRNFNEWWNTYKHDLKRINYGIYLSHDNFSGNQDKLRLIALGGFTPQFQISYRRPYVDKAKKTGFSVGINYVQNRDLAFQDIGDKIRFFESDHISKIEKSAYLNVNRREGFYQYHTLGIDYKEGTISDSLRQVHHNYILGAKTSQTFTQLSYVFRYDNRDRIQYALKGRYIGLGLTQQGIFSKDDLHQTVISGSYAQYFKLKPKLFADALVALRFSFPEKQPFSEALIMGYRSDYLRGYELYAIEGQHYGFVKTNLKYQLFSREFHFKRMKIKQFSTLPFEIYGRIFSDVGYVKQVFSEEKKSTLSNKILASLGIGLDAVTWYNYVFRINYSMNRIGERNFFINITRDF